MANPINTFFLLSFLLVILNVNLFITTNATPLEDVCNKVSNRTFCLNDFLENPKGGLIPLPLLGRLAFFRLQGEAETTSKTIHSLRLFPVDPIFKKFLFRCQNLYVDAFAGISTALDDLRNGRYGVLRLHAANAAKAAVSCEGQFRSPYISPLTFENRKFKNLGEILAAIADVLSTKK